MSLPHPTLESRADQDWDTHFSLGDQTGPSEDRHTHFPKNIGEKADIKFESELLVIIYGFSIAGMPMGEYS